MSGQRKMAFFEVGKGKLGNDMQELFEKAQVIAKKRELPIKIDLKITVYPPDDSAQFGGVSYTTDLKQPAKVSEKYITLLNDNGTVVKGAEEPLDQMNLLEGEKNEVEFRKSAN